MYFFLLLLLLNLTNNTQWNTDLISYKSFLELSSFSEQPFARAHRSAYDDDISKSCHFGITSAQKKNVENKPE